MSQEFESEILDDAVEDSEDSPLPIIKQSSEYYVDEDLIYVYEQETGLLKLDIGKKDFQALLENLGTFPEEGASFCFLLPQIGEVCFTGVHKIERIAKEREGFIRRISRILRRRN